MTRTSRWTRMSPIARVKDEKINRRLLGLYITAVVISMIELATFALAMDLRRAGAMVYPVCQDHRSYWDGRSDNILDVEGEMADDFLIFFKKRVPSNVSHLPSNPRRLYVTWGASPDRRELLKQTLLTVRDVIAKRYGQQADRDILRRRARPPAPDFHEFDAYPTCDAIRKMALQGGEWAESGPPLTYLK